MTRATTIIAILFFIVCLSLAYVSSNRSDPQSVTGSVMTQEYDDAAGQDAGDLPPDDGDSAGSQDSDLPPAE